MKIWIALDIYLSQVWATELLWRSAANISHKSTYSFGKMNSLIENKYDFPLPIPLSHRNLNPCSYIQFCKIHFLFITKSTCAVNRGMGTFVEHNICFLASGHTHLWYLENWLLFFILLTWILICKFVNVLCSSGAQCVEGKIPEAQWKDVWLVELTVHDCSML